MLAKRKVFSQRGLQSREVGLTKLPHKCEYDQLHGHQKIPVLELRVILSASVAPVFKSHCNQLMLDIDVAMQNLTISFTALGKVLTFSSLYMPANEFALTAAIFNNGRHLEYTGG